MQLYYVYDSWARDRGRIHRAECPNCNHGRGMMPTPSTQHGAWHGPFTDREEAFAFAAALGRSDMTACRKCDP